MCLSTPKLENTIKDINHGVGNQFAEMAATQSSIRGNGILNSVVWVSRQLMEEKRLRI